jgi:hypothetical protein
MWSARTLLLLAVAALRPASGFVHGWDTVGDMLGTPSVFLSPLSPAPRLMVIATEVPRRERERERERERKSYTVRD